jgi:hypothetical protein
LVSDVKGRVFENRILRIFGPKRVEMTGNGGSCSMRSFIICTHPQISLGKSSQGEVGGACSTHGRGERIVQGFVGKPPKERDHLEDQVVGGNMGSEWIL